MEKINIAAFDFDDNKIAERLLEIQKNTNDLNKSREEELEILKELQKEQEILSKKLKEASSSGNLNAKELENLIEKQNALVKSTVESKAEVSKISNKLREFKNETEELVKAKDSEIEKTKEATKETSKQASEVQKEYDKVSTLISSIERLTLARENERNRITQLTKEQREIIKQMDLMSKSGRGMSDEYNVLKNKSNEYTASIAEARRGVDIISKQTSAYNSELKTLEKTLDLQDKALKILNSDYDLESKSIQQLRNDRTALIALRNEEVAVMGEQSDRAKELNKLIADTTNQEKKLVAETEQRFYQIGDYAGQLQGHFEGLKDAISQLGRGDVVGGINTLKTSVGGLTTSLMAFVTTPLGAAITVLAGIGLAAKYVWDYNAAIKENLTIVSQLTKQTGEQADSIRQYAQSLKDTYGKDFKDTILEVKSLVEDFNLSYSDAFRLYSEGLAKGGAANKEFSNSIDEYGVQFQQAGYNAEEFISLINAGFDLDIYKDKLPDAIKEAKISLEEATKSTRDALVNAFGASFSDSILKRVRLGQTSVKDALIEISAEAKKANLNQQQLAELTASVFRGAGEDAGGAAKIFQAVNKSVEDINVPMSELEQKTYDLQQSFLELEKAKDEAFKSDSLIKFQKDSEIVWNQFKTGFVIAMSAVVTGGVDGFTQIGAGVRTLNDYLLGVERAIDRLSFTNLKDSWNDFTKSVADFNWSATYESYAGSSSAQGQILDKAKKDAISAMNGVLDDVKTMTQKVLDKNKPKPNETPTVPTTKKIKKATAKVDDSKKELENALKINEKYLKNLADLQFQYAQSELSNQIKNDADKLKNAQILTEEMLNLEKNRLDKQKDLQDEYNQNELAEANRKAQENSIKELSEIEKLKITEEQKNELKLNSDKVLKEQLALNQQTYQQKEIENDFSFRELRDSIENEYNENKRILEEQRKAFDFEQSILTLQNNGATENQIKMYNLNKDYQDEMAALRDQLNNKKITLEQFAIASENITKKKEDSEMKIKEVNSDLELELISNTLGTVSDILGKNTAAGKAFGIAQALINTWQGVTQVWKAESLLPEPYATIGKVASTATVLSSGLNAIKQIKKVDTSGKGTASAPSTASAGTTTNSYKESYAGAPVQGGGINSFNQDSLFKDSNNSNDLRNSIKEGAKEGAREGSKQGIKGLSTDRSIQNEAIY